MNRKYGEEIDELNNKVNKVDDKIGKTQNDKAILEEKKSDSSKQMMTPETYSTIRHKVAEIMNVILPSSTKTTERKVLDLLLDLEKYIDKSFTMYNIVQLVEFEIGGCKNDHNLNKESGALAKRIYKLRNKAKNEQLKLIKE